VTRARPVASSCTSVRSYVQKKYRGRDMFGLGASPHGTQAQMWFLTDFDVRVLIHLSAILIGYKHSCFKNMNQTLGIKSRTLDREYS
jgi:hypothetical protein